MASKKAEEFKAKGNDFFQRGSYKEAITWYSKAIQEAPKESVYYSNRSAAYASLRQWNESLQDATKCADLKPDWVKGHYRKGIALFELKRFEEAEGVLKRGLQLEPTNAEMKSKLEEIEKNKKKSGPRFHPNGTPMSPSQSTKEDGNEAFKESRYEHAIEMYTRALALCTPEESEDKAAIYNNRAACYSQLHHYPEVVKDCTECLAIQPKNIKALIRRGIALEALEKFEKALEDMRAVLAMDPSTQVAQQASNRISNALRSFKHH